MLSLKNIVSTFGTKRVPGVFLHTSVINQANASSRAELKKDLIKEKGLKKPASAYILFTKVERPKIKRENPELTTMQISSKLGAKWATLSQVEKQPFVDQYNQNYKIYKDQLAQIESKLPPKKPVNGFVLFGNEIRSQLKIEFPNIDQIEITKKIGEKWKNLPEQKKTHYNELYKQNMIEWKKQSSDNN